MIYARKGSERILAKPKTIGSCLICRAPVFSIETGGVYHWSHMGAEECDPWLCGETDWTIYWKQTFVARRVEVVVSRDAESHFSDIQTESQVSIKLWNQVTPPVNLPEIESFFGPKMIWIIDSRSSGVRLGTSNDSEAEIFLPFVVTNSLWTESKRPLFFEVEGSELLFFESGDGITSGSGKVIDKERFLRKYNH